jgi:hypothetical protein
MFTGGLGAGRRATVTQEVGLKGGGFAQDSWERMPCCNLAATLAYTVKVLVYELVAISAPRAIVPRWVERNPLGSVSIDVGVSHIDDFVARLAKSAVHWALRLNGDRA